MVEAVEDFLGFFGLRGEVKRCWGMTEVGSIGKLFVVLDGTEEDVG